MCNKQVYIETYLTNTLIIFIKNTAVKCRCVANVYVIFPDPSKYTCLILYNQCILSNVYTKMHAILMRKIKH